MKILVTNDDGFQSPLIRILCEALHADFEVVLVAPSKEQSGIGQAISMYNSLAFEELTHYKFPAYRIEGTPSDCVKFAVCHLFPGVKFDLVISGINPGENAGLSALYSGTVAGAREGAAWGIPSIALSVWDNSPTRAEMASLWLHRIIKDKSLIQFKPGVFWNVNFPKCQIHQIKGVRVSKMSTAMFKDHYQEFVTPRGNSEYWLDGVKHVEQFAEGTDDAYLYQNFITITPLQIDQTCEPENRRLLKFKNLLTTHTG